MGWEKRKHGAKSGYFYRSVRNGDHVRKVYYGRGEAGHEAAAERERKIQGRQEAAKLLWDDRNDTEEADKLATELREWGKVLLSTWLILSGYRKHRGQWRKTNYE